MANAPEDNTKQFIPSSSEIRDQYLRDVRLGFLAADLEEPLVTPGTDHYIEGIAISNMLLPLYASIFNLGQDSSELTATGKQLDKIREALGLLPVGASAASGKIIPEIIGSGSINFTDGIEFTLPNGFRGKVDGSQVVSSGEKLQVVTIDKGEDANLNAGENVRFVSPPSNVEIEAEVDIDGLTGGRDEETDERKRERILNRRANLPGGGNNAQLVEFAERSTLAVQKAFIYAAPEGPGNTKVIVQKSMKFNVDNPDFSRELGDATVQIVADEILNNVPQPNEIVTQSAENDDVDLALELQLPDESVVGRQVISWTNSDANLFPKLVSADNGRITVTNVTNTSEIVIDAQTNDAPVDFQSQILWWSPVKRKFKKATIISHSSGSGSWRILLDRPLSIDAEDVAVGDFISPKAENFEQYRSSILNIMNKLAPGEITTDSDRLPRAARDPSVETTWFSDLTNVQVSEFIRENSEIIDTTYSHRSKTSPSLPSSLADPAKVLRLKHFAIYKKV